jgi:AcrR family transcriptional regulator
MAVMPRSVRLGHDDLGAYSHVCALFEGPADAGPVLRDFVREGIEHGERVIHIVETPSNAVERQAGRRDVSEALESGQLAMRAWSETYLPAGRFRGADMAEVIRQMLREGSELGYPATRAIGDMEWAQDGVPGVEELVAYERDVSAIVERPHAIVCAYDMRRHTASRISAVVAAHEAVFVGGRLQRPDGFGRGQTPRTRILGAASRLFTETGIRATGVDTLIREAGVAKATFYRHFPSKDDLIVAWLEDPRTRWFERVRRQAEIRAAGPGDLVPELFNAAAEWLEDGDYRGCPYLNSAVEITHASHRAVPVIRAYLGEIERYLQRMVAAAGYAEPDALGTALQAMLAGSLSLGVAHRSKRFVFGARLAAERLLAVSPRSARRS